MRILEDAGNIEDFSSEMEGGEETPQQKQQRAATNSKTPQQMWGNTGIPDDNSDIPDGNRNVPEEKQNINQIAARWKFNPQHFENFVTTAQKGFTPALYNQLKSMIGGDIDNFMMDLQRSMPAVYDSFLDAGYENTLDAQANSFQPGQGKQQMKLAPLMQNQANQASWNDLATQTPNYSAVAKDPRLQTQEKTNPQRKF